MAAARRSGEVDSDTRTALLDAAERLMLDEGYAAVTSRRVAGEAGLNNALVYYYFGTMDELFLAVFRRRAEWMLERQAEALSSDQPLWALWGVTHDQANTALNLEFMALGNHRKAIRAEVATYSRKFRRAQLDALSGVLEGYGIDPETWPPVSVILLLSAVSRFLLMEDAYGLDMGHAETIAIIEHHLRLLEGERRAKAPSRSGVA
ncbi:MAG: TetR/AcrR family transcriptional regulator [Acidimicrobiales bacterium]